MNELVKWSIEHAFPVDETENCILQTDIYLQGKLEKSEKAIDKWYH